MELLKLNKKQDKVDIHKKMQNTAFKLNLYKFYENMYSNPESFYFTEEGVKESNFWRARSCKMNNIFE